MPLHRKKKFSISALCEVLNKGRKKLHGKVAKIHNKYKSKKL